MNKLALLFPGQGAQYPGMGKPWTGHFPYCKKVFEEAGDILGFDMERLCHEGSSDELHPTEKTQPALLTVSYAAYQVYLHEVGIKPAVVAGHSLGEITALTCAGAITFAEALQIVEKRGQLMQKAVMNQEGIMVAVIGLEQGIVEKVCLDISNNLNQVEFVVVSNINASLQTVISGHRRAVDAAVAELQGLGAHTIPLKVSAPFHSPLMLTSSQEFREFLQAHTFTSTQYPVLSNVDGAPYTDHNDIVDKLVKQLTSPVQWMGCMDRIADMHIATTLELGPGRVLTQLIQQEHPAIQAYCSDRIEEFNQLIHTANVSFLQRCLAYAVSTENRNLQLKDTEYQLKIVQPYRNLEQMLERLENDQEKLTEATRQHALDLLSAIFAGKEVDPFERKERMDTLIRMGGH